MPKKYIIRGGDFYQASKVAADMSLALRDWEFMFDQSMITGSQQYETPVVYQTISLDIETEDK